jgi:hypothetical protein
MDPTLLGVMTTALANCRTSGRISSAGAVWLSTCASNNDTLFAVIEPVAALAPDPGKTPRGDVAMAEDCEVYGAGELAIAGVISLLGVSYLTGWVQVVVGSLLGTLIVAIMAGRLLRWRSTSLLEEVPASHQAASAEMTAPRDPPAFMPPVPVTRAHGR